MLLFRRDFTLYSCEMLTERCYYQCSSGVRIGRGEIFHFHPIFCNRHYGIGDKHGKWPLSRYISSLQGSRPYLNGRSPVWVYVCSFSLPIVLKAIVQCEHRNSGADGFDTFRRGLCSSISRLGCSACCLVFRLLELVGPSVLTGGSEGRMGGSCKAPVCARVPGDEGWQALSSGGNFGDAGNVLAAFVRRDLPRVRLLDGFDSVNSRSRLTGWPLRLLWVRRPVSAFVSQSWASKSGRESNWAEQAEQVHLSLSSSSSALSTSSGTEISCSIFAGCYNEVKNIKHKWISYLCIMLWKQFDIQLSGMATHAGYNDTN